MDPRANPSDEFLGSGWALPVRLAGSEIVLAAGPDAVAQSIWSILATAPGERVGQPLFGCGIHDLVFSTGGAPLTLVAEQVRGALELWEPRIDVVGVRVEDRSAELTLLIHVEYALRTAPGVHNLVFPFYLEGTE
jgi:phage baseplate assembly protein W